MFSTRQSIDGLPSSPAASSAGGEQIKYRNNNTNYPTGRPTTTTSATGVHSSRTAGKTTTTVVHTIHKPIPSTNNENNNGMGSASANVWAHIYKPLPVVSSSQVNGGGVQPNTTSTTTQSNTKIPPPPVPTGNSINNNNANKTVPGKGLSPAGQGLPRTQRSPGAAVTGMTRSEILSSKTPDLANYLQSQITLLFHRTAEDSSPYVHSIRQINEMVTEVLARWRKSTTLALNSIDSLESELAKKMETITEISTKYAEKLTDKDTIIASLEAEKETLRIYAQRLEVHLGRMIEATAQIMDASNMDSAKDNGEVSSSSSSPLPAPLVTALKELLSAARTDYRNPSVNLTTNHHNPNTVADMEGLKAAVKEGSDNVVQFFADFDATYSSSSSRTEPSHSSHRSVSSSLSEQPKPTALSHSNNSSSLSPSASLSMEHQQALRNIDSTLQRALAFTTQKTTDNSSKKSNGNSSSNSSLSTKTSNIETSPTANSHSQPAETVVTPEPTKPTNVTSGKKVLSLDIELDPVMHSRATVGQLRTAISIKAGRKPLSLSINGKSLADDSAKLTEIGVPVKSTIEVIFDDPSSNSSTNNNSITATLTSVINSHNKKPPVPSQPTVHVPKPAQPLSVPSKLSPPTSKQPLTSPAPHRAPRELSALQTESTGSATKNEENTKVPELSNVSSAVTTIKHHIHDDDDEDLQPTASLSKLQHTTKVSIPSLAQSTNSSTLSTTATSSMATVPLPSLPSPSLVSSPLNTNKSPILLRTDSARLNENNGKVTGSLLHAALAHPSQDGQREIIIRSIFNTVDRDGSGTLSLKELENYVAAVQKKLQRNTNDDETNLETPNNDNNEFDDNDDRLPDGSPTSFYTAEDNVEFDTPLDSTNDMPLSPGFQDSQRSITPRKRLSRTVSSSDIDAILAADGVPLTLHAAFCSVLAESGSLATAFIELDRNHDGIIDFEEFRTIGDAMFLRADDKVEIARRTALEREQRLTNLDSAKKAALDAEQAKLAELRAIHAEYEAIEATERKLRAAAAMAMTSSSASATAVNDSNEDTLSFDAIHGLSNQRKQFSPKALPPSLPPPSNKQSLSPLSLIPKPKGTNTVSPPSSSSSSSSSVESKSNGMFISQPASSIPVPRRLSPLVKPRAGNSGPTNVSGVPPPPPPPPPSRKGEFSNVTM